MASANQAFDSSLGSHFRTFPSTDAGLGKALYTDPNNFPLPDSPRKTSIGIQEDEPELKSPLGSIKTKDLNSQAGLSDRSPLHTFLHPRRKELRRKLGKVQRAAVRQRLVSTLADWVPPPVPRYFNPKPVPQLTTPSDRLKACARLSICTLVVNRRLPPYRFNTKCV